MDLSIKLEDLLRYLHVSKVTGNTRVTLHGLAYHTDHVKVGSVFFCLKGTHADGHDFIPLAVKRGAAAVVMEEDREVEGSVKILVPSVRVAMALSAELFYGSPTRHLRLIGVTGTNGKTTTTHLIDEILQAWGKKSALLGTIKYRIGTETLPALATTPEAPDLQKMLRLMCDRGVEYGVMEVSSHSLEQHRVSGCDFNTAVLTNITEDHLDFHQNFERYLAAKGKLFSQLGGSFWKENAPRFAVINRDDRHAQYFIKQATVQTVCYGVYEGADVQAQQIEIKSEGVSYDLTSPWGSLRLNLKMTGMFSVYNTLAAITTALLEGVELQQIKHVLEQIGGVPGRFERVDLGQDYLVIVDYAHTPDGLENILKTARQFARNKIITIFGCGGERDRLKRPIMGRIAGEYSDFCILTSDNPRGEDPWQIIGEVEVGLQEKKQIGSGYTVQPDRYEAIKLGIELARPDDMVIIAGKGHEDYQIFSDYTITFSDRDVAAELIRQRLNQQGQ